MIQDDINSLVKPEKINKTLPELPQNDGFSSKRAANNSDLDDQGYVMIKPPLSFKALTHDPAENVDLEDSSGNAIVDQNGDAVVIIKIKTAVAIDANNQEIPFDNIDLDNSVATP